MNRLTIALVQQTCTNDHDATLTKTCDLIRQAAAKGARLVLLQELHSGPYFCQTEETTQFDRAEPIPGPTSERLGALAGELEIVLVASLFERRAAGLYHNTAVVFETDGSIAGIYRKMHIPDDPGFLRKILLHPRRSGLYPDPDLAWQAGGAGLLGSMVSRGGPPDGPGRSRTADLPHRHRLGPQRHPRRARASTVGLGNHPAGPCRGQRSAGAVHQPGWP